MTVQVGEVIDGRYKLLEELGHGAMGVVYKARHLQMEKTVAIKVLAAVALGDYIGMQRFVREAKILASLEHPNVVTAQSFGLTEDGTPFIVMEFVDGNNFSQWQRTTRQDDASKMKNGLKIFVQISDALSFIHEHGIIHRDIKPTNIIITESESDGLQAKLIDFGTGRIFDAVKDEQSLTKTGVLLGSPIYMAPEQWSGIKADQRADIFALGCVMYEYFTGQKYIQGTNLPEILQAHFLVDAEKSLAPCAIFATCEQAKLVISKALKKDPGERYQTARALNNDLVQISSGGKIKPSEEKLPGSAGNKKPAKKHRRKLLISAIAALIVLSAAATLLFLTQGNPPRQTERENHLDATFERIRQHATDVSAGITNDAMLKRQRDLTINYLKEADSAPPGTVATAQRLYALWQLARSYRLLGESDNAAVTYQQILPMLETWESQTANTNLTPLERELMLHIDSPTARFDLATSCLRAKSRLAVGRKACERIIADSSKLTRAQIDNLSTNMKRRMEWVLAVNVLLCRAAKDKTAEKTAYDELLKEVRQAHNTSGKMTAVYADEIIDFCDQKVAERHGVHYWRG